jgi:hypothetical protein
VGCSETYAMPRRVRHKLRILQRLGGEKKKKKKIKKDVTAPTKRKHMLRH